MSNLKPRKRFDSFIILFIPFLTIGCANT